MAKALIAGQTVENKYGDVWDQAVLVVDALTIDFLSQVLKFKVDIYRNATARTDGDKPIERWYVIDKTTFLANFDSGLAITTLKSQAEDYVLTLTDSDANLLYGDTFE